MKLRSTTTLLLTLTACAALSGGTAATTGALAMQAPSPTAKPKVLVFFKSESAELTPSGLFLVEEVGRRLDSEDAGKSARLVGHANEMADAEADLALSIERAKAVEMVLLDQGIAADRITAYGVGREGTGHGISRDFDKRVDFFVE